jgi:hypothetical protein
VYGKNYSVQGDVQRCKDPQQNGVQQTVKAILKTESI